METLPERLSCRFFLWILHPLRFCPVSAFNTSHFISVWEEIDANLALDRFGRVNLKEDMNNM